MSGWPVWDRAIPFLITGLSDDLDHRRADRARNRAAESARLADERLARLLRRWSSRHICRAVVDSSSDAIISKSLDGLIQTWNQGAQQIYGYTAEETVGKACHDAGSAGPAARRVRHHGADPARRQGEALRNHAPAERRKDIQVSLTHIADSAMNRV